MKNIVLVPVAIVYENVLRCFLNLVAVNIFQSFYECSGWPNRITVVGLIEKKLCMTKRVDKNWIYMEGYLGNVPKFFIKLFVRR